MERTGIKPPTSRLVGDGLYHLPPSYRFKIRKSKTIHLWKTKNTHSFISWFILVPGFESTCCLDPFSEESACSLRVCGGSHWVVSQGFFKQTKDLHGVWLIGDTKLALEGEDCWVSFLNKKINTAVTWPNNHYQYVTTEQLWIDLSVLLHGFIVF